MPPPPLVYQKLITGLAPASLDAEWIEDVAVPSSYAVGEHFEQFIRLQVESGRYTSASEVVRAGLRLLEDQERLRQLHLEELRQLIREGSESGPVDTPQP
jgi:antitoxin ParD1/3/4